MKVLSSLLTISVTSLLLMGCQTMSSTVESTKNKMPTERGSQQMIAQQNNIQQITPSHLASYDWTLVSAVDKDSQTLALMTELKKINVTATMSATESYLYPSVQCNRMATPYVLNDNRLDTTIGNTISTAMGCGQHESKFMSLVLGISQLELLTNDKEGSAQLTQTNQNGDTLVWQGQQTPESKYNQVGDTVFWEIDNVQPLCPDGKANTCLKVRPVYYDKQGIKQGVGDWDIFVDNIDGYTHDSEYKQIVRLKRFVTDPVDVKGKQFVYVFDTVVESSVAQ